MHSAHVCDNPTAKAGLSLHEKGMVLKGGMGS